MLNECTKAQCRNAQDFSELCPNCIAEFEAWSADSTPEFDWDEWANYHQPEEPSIPDFDPTEFDQWTGRNDDV